MLMHAPIEAIVAPEIVLKTRRKRENAGAAPRRSKSYTNRQPMAAASFGEIIPRTTHRADELPKRRMSFNQHLSPKPLR